MHRRAVLVERRRVWEYTGSLRYTPERGCEAVGVGQLLVMTQVRRAAVRGEGGGWLPQPVWVQLAGYVLLIAGFLGVTWAQSVNRHFETTVRIHAPSLWLGSRT